MALYTPSVCTKYPLARAGWKHFKKESNTISFAKERLPTGGRASHIFSKETKDNVWFLSMLIQTARGSVQLTLVETIVFKSSHTAQNSLRWFGNKDIGCTRGRFGSLVNKKKPTKNCSSISNNWQYDIRLCPHIAYNILFLHVSAAVNAGPWMTRFTLSKVPKKTGPPPGESFASALPRSSRSSNTSSPCWQIAAAFSPMPAFYIYPACLADDVASSWPRALLDVSEELQCMCKCVFVWPTAMCRTGSPRFLLAKVQVAAHRFWHPSSSRQFTGSVSRRTTCYTCQPHCKLAARCVTSHERPREITSEFDCAIFSHVGGAGRCRCLHHEHVTSRKLFFFFFCMS